MRIIILLVAFTFTHNVYAYKVKPRGNGWFLDCKDKNGNTDGHYSGAPEGTYDSREAAENAGSFCTYGIASIKKVKTTLSADENQ